MSYSLKKFLVHHFSEKITVFQFVSVLPNWDMVFWLDFLIFFLVLLIGRKVEGWQGANYKSFIFKMMFWPTSGTEEIIITAFGCGVNYATGCGSLSDHTTPANCIFLPLFSYYSDNPIFSSILSWKMVAWKAERAEDKIRILDFDFTGAKLCVFPSPVSKAMKNLCNFYHIHKRLFYCVFLQVHSVDIFPAQLE